MKLLMFRDGEASRLGVGRDGSTDEVIDVAAAANGAGPGVPATVLDVVDGGEAALERLRVLVSSAPAGAVRPLAELTLLPPFDPPRGNVLAIGRNYQKHAEETARASNVEVGPPTIFTKAITTITAPYADIRIDPSVSSKIDWEVELGVVIGRRGANIKRQDAAQPHLRLHGAQRCDRPRYPEWLGRPVVQGQEPRRILPRRPVGADTR